MAKKLRRPIYFSLGNHDYYHGSAPAKIPERFDEYRRLDILVRTRRCRSRRAQCRRIAVPGKHRI
ncbi:MAG: hypothetical protein HN348_30915 [Proteobacteria bacterium]|nr:hypothetical protein [Pseudomonadota bacterium]